MAYSTDIEAAKALATKAHAGQTDKAGLPYITHPERVAARLETPELQVIGWLHDTVEDTLPRRKRLCSSPAVRGMVRALLDDPDVAQF